jgi:uncharacterized GH25 family protein
MLRSLLLATATLLTAAPAFAHAGFLVPIAEPDEAGEVLLYATFSDTFPATEIGLASETWVIVTPAGDEADFERAVERAQHTILQATLSKPGIYRLSSGERLGRKGEVARIGDDYVLLGRDGMSRETLPAGAEILTSQTATVSDIYLSREEGAGAALDSSIGRLEIAPAVDPTDLQPGGRFSADILFDDMPLGQTDITLFSPGESREEGEPETTLVTNEDGRVSFVPPGLGEYLLMVRRIAPAPEGAETDVRSYTTTLTLLVGEAE